ncbi:MAG: hypothetical protein QOG13_2597 [Sphingomonadales bacterium]|jgi:hypothetical protein|nr:hypothetical protein [Sphingomonadales bacterium]
MKIMTLVVATIIGLSAQASFAQSSNCSRCEQPILDKLTQIAANTDALKGDGVAVRAELGALTRAVIALARRPRQPLLINDAVLTDAMGDLAADRINGYCRTIGYRNGLALAPTDGAVPLRTIGAGLVTGRILCYDAAE